MQLTYAFCTYNRASRLPALVRAMRSLECPIPFEILAVNNNSQDATLTVLKELAAEDGAPLRVVTEVQQGIAHARNRALDEAMASDYLVFIDDDELPKPGLLRAAVESFEQEGSDCVGGRVQVAFGKESRPKWLTDELLPFMAETDYGPSAFWVEQRDQPMWTANIGYRMQRFREDPSLRFDVRYNRVGHSIGGGEDVRMFEAWFDRGHRIRYRPDMAVEHYVDAARLQRSYFWRIHYAAGQRRGRYTMAEYDECRFGIPLFLLRQAGSRALQSLLALLSRNPRFMRISMNFTYALGILHGRVLARRDAKGQTSEA